MIRQYEKRTDKGYEIQHYDSHGHHSRVTACDTLEEVTKVLISVCNANISGNFPTIWLDGEIIR